ncbi:MAG: hypothetical protein L3J15_03330 [Devosiaceae bacterium]|nr:hypothetical protein [Devosiaceae bacterium]
MEAILPLIMQLVGGGLGGGAVGKLVKGSNMGGGLNMITGAVGGLGGTAIAGMIPGLQGLIGKGAAMAGDASTAVSGLDIGALAGQGVTGLVGGGLLTLVVGFVKNKFMG